MAIVAVIEKKIWKVCTQVLVLEYIIVYITIHNLKIINFIFVVCYKKHIYFLYRL
jgi:hypothetical protein